MTTRLAIDYGTTNTVAVVSTAGEQPRVVTVDGAPRMPSAVLSTVDGALVVGMDALRLGRSAADRLETRPKSRIDEGQLLLGSRTVDVALAVRAVLERVCAEASGQAGAAVDEIVLTHPADWGAVRLGTLLRAAEGLAARVSVAPEPVAALSAAGIAPGRAMLVLDFGGGTCDAAVVRTGAVGYSVLSCAGLPDLGGDDLDQRIVDHVRAARPGAVPEMSTSDGTLVARRRLTLRQDARAAKELLSRHSAAEVSVPGADAVRIDRAEFDTLVAADLDRAAHLGVEVLARSGLDSADVTGVYLVGGSSRIPGLGELVGRRTGLAVTSAREPESCVAWGALGLLDAQGSTPAVERVEATVPGPSSVPAASVPSLSPAGGSRRKPVLAMAAGVVAVLLGVIAFTLPSSRIAGTGQPEALTAPDTQTPADGALDQPVPGDPVVGQGKPVRTAAAPGSTARYAGPFGDQADVRIDRVEASDIPPPATGYRWILAQATVTVIAGDPVPPSIQLTLELGLVDDRGQRLAPVGSQQNPPGCQEYGPDSADVPVGGTFTACELYLIPRTTPIKGVLYGESMPDRSDPGSLLFPADIPAVDGQPAGVLPPAGELGGAPTEAVYVTSYLNLQAQLIETPSGYFSGRVDPPPGVRYVLARVAVTPTTEKFVRGRQDDLLQLLDDRGARLETSLQFFSDTTKIQGCPDEIVDLPPGETGIFCEVLAVNADTPIGGLSMAFEGERPDRWLWWRKPR